MSTVQLRLGDMFDGPSDLIVLPCSTAGTITSFVREKLVNYRIPYPRPGLILGDVRVSKSPFSRRPVFGFMMSKPLLLGPAAQYFP